MNLCIFGTGYVGLVTGACFAEMGHDVVCCDIDAAKIALLQSGGCPIYEPGLPEMLDINQKDKRLTFTTDAVAAIGSAEIIFIAVGTPSSEDGGADLTHVLNVAQGIGEHMAGYRAVVVKSTVPVGSCGRVREAIGGALQRRGAKHPFDVISNPEFLKEGSALEDCLKPSRVVVGCDSDRARTIMHDLYTPFLKSGNPLLLMDVKSSELTKYAANAMLATKISLMNELSCLCERVGANIEAVRQGIGSDERIGRKFIYAGLGYGGSCFPKDLRALIKTTESADESSLILRAVQDINRRQRERFFTRLERAFDGNLQGRRIAVWGLAFKPGTDDVREAPALYLIERLLAAGAQVVAYDPVAVHNVRRLIPHPALSFVDDHYDALHNADALCVATEWMQFREPNFAKMRKLMRQFVIFDGRNIYDGDRLAREHACHYHGIGRRSIPAVS